MAKAKKRTTAKKTKAKATAKAKSKTTLHFDVSIQKVFEKMKAIVDNNKEAEFLQKCQALKVHRFVTVNARIVKLVKDFVVEHALGPSLGRVEPLGASPDLHTARLVRAPASVATAAAAPVDDETCFKHR